MKTLVALSLWAKVMALFGRTERCNWCGKPIKPNHYNGCTRCLEGEFGTPDQWEEEWKDSSWPQKIQDVLDPEELEHPDVQDQQPLTCCKCGKINPDMWDPFTDTDWCLDCWYKENSPSEQLIKSLPKCEVDFED